MPGCEARAATGSLWQDVAALLRQDWPEALAAPAAVRQADRCERRVSAMNLAMHLTMNLAAGSAARPAGAKRAAASPVSWAPVPEDWAPAAAVAALHLGSTPEPADGPDRRRLAVD
jgi:hypothetical protein